MGIHYVLSSQSIPKGSEIQVLQNQKTQSIIQTVPLKNLPLLFLFSLIIASFWSDIESPRLVFKFSLSYFPYLLCVFTLIYGKHTYLHFPETFIDFSLIYYIFKLLFWEYYRFMGSFKEHKRYREVSTPFAQILQIITSCIIREQVSKPVTCHVHNAQFIQSSPVLQALVCVCVCVHTSACMQFYAILSHASLCNHYHSQDTKLFLYHRTSLFCPFIITHITNPLITGSWQSLRSFHLCNVI